MVETGGMQYVVKLLSPARGRAYLGVWACLSCVAHTSLSLLGDQLRQAKEHEVLHCYTTSLYHCKRTSTELEHVLTTYMASPIVHTSEGPISISSHTPSCSMHTG